MDFFTKSVHSGVDKDKSYNSVITPIYPTSTFFWDKLGHNRGYDYTRSGNPTRDALAENLAALEGGEAASCTSTGMSAIAAVLHILRPGDHVIAGNDIYGGTYRLMTSIFARLNVEFTFIDLRKLNLLEKSIRDNTRMIWIETPSNPLLNVVDIGAVAGIAKKYGILTVTDNTFLSPYFQRPLELGCDVVVHSTTKYINGHSDVVGGAVISKKRDIHEEFAFNINALGLGESPFDSWLVLRGVKTLGLRMRQHEKNAKAIAEFLAEHPYVEKVYYPSLDSHPDRVTIKKQMTGYGGIVSFCLDTSKVSLNDFFGRLSFFKLAESLGGVESLIEAPWYMSHASMPEDARKEAGISRNCVRISAGIEDTKDLIGDIKEALR